jgi:hypothetical protein
LKSGDNSNPRRGLVPAPLYDLDHGEGVRGLV